MTDSHVTDSHGGLTPPRSPLVILEILVSVSANDPPPQRLTITHWLILIMAAIGFGFDIYVLLMFQYIGPELLRELLPGAKLRLAWGCRQVGLAR